MFGYYALFNNHEHGTGRALEAAEMLLPAVIGDNGAILSAESRGYP